MTQGQRAVRVLIVDDSAFMRHVLRRMLERDPAIAIVATAKSGEESLPLVAALRPDVVTMDVQMRGIGGLEALRRIVAGRGPPVIMVSSQTYEGAQTTFTALELGAVDFIAKPRPNAGVDEIVALGEELIAKVRAFGLPRAALPPAEPRTVARTPRPGSFGCLAIGTSTGGPVALARILEHLPANFPLPIAIVQHMPPGFTGPLAQRLNSASPIDVVEAVDGTALLPGRALIAPAGKNFSVEREGDHTRARISGSETPSVAPSVDALFTDVAEHFGERGLCAILTGMGRDGVEGLRVLRERGGFALGQDEPSCVIYGMPRSAAEAGLIDRVVSLDEFPAVLCAMAGLGVALPKEEGRGPAPPGT